MLITKPLWCDKDEANYKNSDNDDNSNNDYDGNSRNNQ